MHRYLRLLALPCCLVWLIGRRVLSYALSLLLCRRGILIDASSLISKCFGFDVSDPGRSPRGQRVAVIGGGIAGCGAAWSCARAGAKVTLYEARKELGGNAKTFTWEDGTTTGLSVLAWPAQYFHNYCRLLRELKIESTEVDLPFMVGPHTGQMVSSAERERERDGDGRERERERERERGRDGPTI